jgi:CarD family transcriptional regulator, regulator of rRNA transcription
MIFTIGERVVHPQHGVGHVVKLENREFERGVIQQYYEISIPGGSTVWVPVDMPNSGLRKLALKSELEHCREILKSHPSPLTEDGRVRQAGLVAYLKRGTITAHCEIVRDLSAFVNHKPAYGTITAFLQAILSVLCQEWAIVEGITLSAATYEISTLLEKGKLARRENKT